jgi:uncharacterized repeat protein (TIGR03803 family)
MAAATPAGGTNNEGTIYRIGQGGDGFQVLHSFGDYDSYPAAPVIQGADGALYGTCYLGSVVGGGTGAATYKINTDGSGYTVLVYPTHDSILGSLVQGADGELYGNAVKQNEYGVLFRVDPNGGGLTTIYTNTDGYSEGAMVQIGPFLFGTTYSGGTSNFGTIFMIETNGSNFQVLHNFGDGTVKNDGTLPCSGLVLADGYFYGTTEGPVGSVYMMDEAGKYYASIYNFNTNYEQNTPMSALTPGTFQPGGGSGALFGTYETTSTGPGGVFGILINPVATITPASVSYGGETMISWPAWAVGYTIQATTNLTSGAWTTVTNATPVLSEQVPTTNSGAMFYRLVSP